MSAEHKLADFLSILPAVLYEYVLYPDGNSELLYLSPSSSGILGHPPDYFVQDVNRFWQMVHPDDLKRIRQEDAQANRNNALFVSEVRVRLPDGRERWLQLSSKPTPEKQHDAVVWIGYIIDITRMKRIETELLEANRKLKALSDTDGLTGLANRRHFDTALHDEWGRYQRSGSPFALILIDIDYFKIYNDQYGHQMGDDCLKRIAAVLQESARRSGDLAARYGGEELVVIAIDTDLAGAQRMAEQIRRAVESLDIMNAHIPAGRVTVSIGVSSIAHAEYPNQQLLLKAADMALYRAKRDQRNCVRVAAPDDVQQAKATDRA